MTIKPDHIEEVLTGQRLQSPEPINTIAANNIDVEKTPEIKSSSKDSIASTEQLSAKEYKELSREYLKAAQDGTTKQLVEKLAAEIKAGSASPEMLNRLIDAHIVERHMAANNVENIKDGGNNFSDKKIQNAVADLLAGDSIPNSSLEMRSGAFREIMSAKELQVKPAEHTMERSIER